MPKLRFIQKITKLKNHFSSSQDHLSLERKKLEKNFLWSFVALILFCIISYKYLDRPLAVFADTLHHGTISLTNTNLTEMLTNVVYLIALLAMGLYAIFHFFNIKNRLVEICGALSLGMAIAFFIKTQAQLIFGRIAPRYDSFQQLNFLRKKSLYGFHLMQVGSFPSGHMVVFTCILLLLGYYYPKIMKLNYALLTVLALILLYDNYHFLSDVVAGTYLGAIIAIILKHLLKIKN
jgi:membrane-associated phospholipid phosphatase